MSEQVINQARWSEADFQRYLAKFEKPVPEGTPKPEAMKSKYRNVKTVVGEIVFDSKREAEYWVGLKARERAGEITELRRQVVFYLLCPTPAGLSAVVARYIADFVYKDRDGQPHVIDAKSKGTRTQVYVLKKKWLELQCGIEIEEV